jgi:hypothetical protein
MRRLKRPYRRSVRLRRKTYLRRESIAFWVLGVRRRGADVSGMERKGYFEGGEGAPVDWKEG